MYVSRDYGLFSHLQGNRSLNKSKIKRIKDDINAGNNLLKYCPIIVVEKEGKLKVIDGQHRLEVAKQLKSNIWYVISEEISLYEIAKMNSNTEKWAARDFINCYAQTGNPHYVTLKEFTTVYGFPLSVNIQLLTKGINVSDVGGGDSITQFQQGKFMVKSEAKAIAAAQEIIKFKEFPSYRSRPFVTALCKIMQANKIVFDEVVKAFENHKDELKQHSGWKDYLVNLEAIVNIGKSKRRVIY